MVPALVLALLSAAPISLPPEAGCTTTCGLRAPLETDCKAFQAHEDATLEAFATYVQGWTPDRTCPLLRGWTVLVTLGHLDAQGAFNIAWSDGNPLAVWGVTYFDHQLIVVATNRWGESALGHELGHIFRRYLDNWDTLDPNPHASHAGWGRLGICTATKALSSLRDGCAVGAY
jgi:hypothetical protein